MSRIKFVVARYEKDNYENFLKDSLEPRWPSKQIDNGGANSIYEKYNVGIEAWKQDGLEDSDILVFAHADVKILDEAFEEKILYAFDKNPHLGVAGVVGSKSINEQGGWWLSPEPDHRGHLMQWVDNDEKNKYHLNRGVGNFFDVAVLDGLILFVRGSLAKTLPFDQTTYPNSYNFYDYDYCLSALELKHNVAVLDVLVEHKSAGYGIFEHDWITNKDIFINKWKSKGYNFPITVV
jgi:hypothetical protein